MTRPNPVKVFDRALLAAAAAAAASPKLSPAEKKRVRTLMTKSRSAKGWNLSERMECFGLVQKAAPEKLPKLPKVIRDRLPGSAKEAPPIRQASHVDPLDRLAKAADLRGEEVLTEEQFVARRDAILSLPRLADWGVEEGVDPLDRVAEAHRLRKRDALTEEQFTHVRQIILDAA